MARRRTTRWRRWRRAAAALVLLTGTAAASAVVWDAYAVRPWTRDGRVRVQVSNMAPQISGQIVDLRVTDNQFVRRGDVLYVIDPIDYKVAVDRAQAELENRAADLEVKRVQAARRASLTTVSTSIEEKQRFAGSAKQAEAAFDLAQAQLAQAKVNLARTQVKSAVNGYVTNLLLRVGDFATVGVSNVSVVDADSYWIDGYFEETKMSHIHVGDVAAIRLMSHSRPLRGRVHSITRGISTPNATPSTQGLPSVDPVYTWVRLAQRVPVRIRIEALPEGVPLIAGMTATIDVQSDGYAPGVGLPSIKAWLVDPRGEGRAQIGGEPASDVAPFDRQASDDDRIPAPKPPPAIPARNLAPNVAPGMTVPPVPSRRPAGVP